jgi:predicted metal-dependent hydrolase
MSGVRVRNQNGRWGSCSPRGGISLNAKLLLLPRPLAQNVVLHELCHIRHRNHGPDFWAELRRLDPETDANEALLRRAWEGLPVWTKWRRSDPA